MEAREGASAEEIRRGGGVVEARPRRRRRRRGGGGEDARAGDGWRRGRGVAVDAEDGGEPAGAVEQTRRTSRRSRSASGVGGAKIRQGFARVVRSRRGTGE